MFKRFLLTCNVAGRVLVVCRLSGKNVAWCWAFVCSVVKAEDIDVYSEQAWSPQMLCCIVWPTDGAPVWVASALHLQEVRH